MTYAILSAWQIPINRGVCEWQLQPKVYIKSEHLSLNKITNIMQTKTSKSF